jgi:phosphoribosylformylglycinamidine synthase
MILFFVKNNRYFAVKTAHQSPENIAKLSWLFGAAQHLNETEISGTFIGPRTEMITPWSTNAVEITQNMSLSGIERIERFTKVDTDFADFDPMLQVKYTDLNQDIFTTNVQPEPILEITNLEAYNQQEGLSLSTEEIDYLKGLAKKLKRNLTDSEVFGFSQINSEHCRHKIFNGTFILDGETMPSSLFKLIKKTSEKNPNDIVSAYKDNVAFVKGPKIAQWAPKSADKPDFYTTKDIDSVLSLKAETHNFPTTVEPFNGAATGSGGEIRDRLAGGKGSLPLAGTAVYMTAYSRLKKSIWETMAERPWLYQTPVDILIKASNGASDFGNKFGQPLISGSVLTFEYDETGDVSTALNMTGRKLGYDKVIMQAGGIGFGKAQDSLKDIPKAGDKIVILGGDNYRIGMGGAAVSSANTGDMSNQLELNAVQRSNPEMQKRAANAIRAMVESDINPIVSIHDHGAGGHLNCLSELVEETGGTIAIDKLPLGDPTLSAKEIIGNESQERMGLIIAKKDTEKLKEIAARERAPFYEVGTVTNDNHFTFTSKKDGKNPIDLDLSDMFGSSPKTIMKDTAVKRDYSDLSYQLSDIYTYTKNVLQLEAVACKDWLTNKVDRCVTGKVAKQQTCGTLQLPLNNVGVMALDYKGIEGMATAIGHAPISALIDVAAGSRNAIAESLTNLIWAPLKAQLQSVSLSANWMWPCRNEGEDVRLYKAVKAVSDFAIGLGINIPTGKDSLSMTQKYSSEKVIAPGTVIISAAGHCNDIKKVVEPVLKITPDNAIYYLNLSQDCFKLGGSSFAQTQAKIGTETPDIKDTAYFKKAFNTIQSCIAKGLICAGHDISAGGLITCLLEMCFADKNVGATVDLTSLNEEDSVKLLFSENAGLVIQTLQTEAFESLLKNNGIAFTQIGTALKSNTLSIKNGKNTFDFDIAQYRDYWYETSYLLDQHQSGKAKAKERFANYKNQPLEFIFPEGFTGKLNGVIASEAWQSQSDEDLSTALKVTSMSQIPRKDERPKAAVVREKGSNSEREMAYAMYLAGFDVKDVHMTDLISGRETLEDIQFIAAVGGFSNSDVLGSAKGWAGSFLYNPKAKKALDNFFAREDTLSLGVCNGCQLFIELGLITPQHTEKPKMLHNDSGKFECNFTSVEILENKSVMLSSLAGSKLGIWAAHGEGKFSFPYAESRYNIVGKYGHEAYPANPNGSDFNTAILTSDDGRHTVMMPHLERSTFPWNWAYYPQDRNDAVSPWLIAFVNAKNWLNNLK